MINGIEIVAIAAVSRDGYIASDNQQSASDWTSGADKDFFISVLKQHKCRVMGKNTFMAERDNFRFPTDVHRLVISNTLGPQELEGVEVVNSYDPEAIAEAARKKGHSKILILGGQAVYKSFLPYTDTFWLTEEPINLLSGIELFARGTVFEKYMRLDSTQQLSTSGTLLKKYVSLELKQDIRVFSS
jgi:dihydrofolate reductase